MNIEDFIGSYCPCCYTKNVYDSTLDFRFCDECGEIWADGANDPDYDYDEPPEDYDLGYDKQA